MTKRTRNILKCWQGGIPLKKKYPFTLDRILKKALFIAIKADDKVMTKKLWALFVSYRKENWGREK